jgi:hypothetical protein
MAQAAIATLGYFGASAVLDQLQLDLDLARVVVGRTLPASCLWRPGGA